MHAIHKRVSSDINKISEFDTIQTQSSSNGQLNRRKNNFVTVLCAGVHLFFYKKTILYGFF